MQYFIGYFFRYQKHQAPQPEIILEIEHEDVRCELKLRRVLIMRLV